MRIGTAILGFVLLAVACGQIRSPAGPPAARGDEHLFSKGREVFLSQGCAECHRREGAGSDKGPDLDRLAGRADPTYVRESILAPQAILVPGYESLIMPPNYGFRLTEAQIDALQYYLSNPAP